MIKTTGRRIHLLHFKPGRGFSETESLDAIDELLGHPDGVIWLDMQSPSPGDLAILHHEFSSHPLALEDVGMPNQRPRIQEIEGDYFIVFYSVSLDGSRLHLAPIWMFLGDNFLVTIHYEPVDELDSAIQRWTRPGIARQDVAAAVLLYSVLDSLVDNYFPVVDQIGERIDDIEDLVVENPSRETVHEVYSLRRQLLELRRTVGPERDVLNVLARHDLPLFGRETAIYFQDVYDHIQRILDTVDTFRDVLIGAVDVYLSTVSNRLNEVMKRMTAIATVLVTLSIITGIGGMNVEFPGRETAAGFWGIVAIMGLVTWAMWYGFRRIEWL